MTDAKIRVLIVDDHPVVLEGLRTLVASQHDMAVVGEAGTGRDALVQSRLLLPDVILLDLRLPDAHGAQVIAAMMAENPEMRIIVLTSYGGDTEIRSAIEAGAMGYLLKDVAREELFAAIRSAARGAPFASCRAASRLLEMTRGEQLTERERHILDLISQGLSNEDIAAALSLSLGTVKTHVHHILRKLEVKDRAAAIAAALRRGFIRTQ